MNTDWVSVKVELLSPEKYKPPPFDEDVHVVNEQSVMDDDDEANIPPPFNKALQLVI